MVPVNWRALETEELSSTFIFATLNQLNAALDRVYKFAISLPDAQVTRFGSRGVDHPIAAGSASYGRAECTIELAAPS
jgi:hypothetical protein